MTALFFTGLWLIMVAAPATPIARTLRVWSVERPAAWLLRVRRGHIALMLVLCAVAGAALWLGGDAIRAVAAGTPDLVAWAITFDLATHADMAIALVVASSTLRLRGLSLRIGAVVRRPATARRRMRRTPRPPRGTPANDDKDGRTRTAA